MTVRWRFGDAEREGGGVADERVLVREDGRRQRELLTMMALKQNLEARFSAVAFIAQ